MAWTKFSMAHSITASPRVRFQPGSSGRVRIGAHSGLIRGFGFSRVAVTVPPGLIRVASSRPEVRNVLGHGWVLFRLGPGNLNLDLAAGLLREQSVTHHRLSGSDLHGGFGQVRGVDRVTRHPTKGEVCFRVVNA